MDGNEFSAYSTVFCLFFLYLKLQTIKLKLLEQNGKYFYQPDEGKVFFFALLPFLQKGEFPVDNHVPDVRERSCEWSDWSFDGFFVFLEGPGPV